MNADTLVLHPDDDVAVALRALQPGEHVPAQADGADVSVTSAVPAGHKIARRALAAGQAVRKYGQIIGVAGRPIRAGDHVHTHNLAFTATGPERPNSGPVPSPSPPADAGFDGIVREDGRVATRNYIAIVTSVNCSATVAKLVAARVLPLLEREPAIDGVIALTHSGGCGLADGEGLQILRRTLAGYAANANVAGVVAIGLGCEVNQLHELDLGDTGRATPVQRVLIQEHGGTTAAVRAGVEAVGKLLPAAGAVRRQKVAAGELILGLNCGGSDSYSGITANPALGVAADLLVACGGTAVLAETPEIYGAEHLLTARAEPAVARALLERIAWWQRYTAASGTNLDGNPSPGNKAGGITTITEKSLGAVAKGGSSPLQAVYRYAEPIRAKGLVFMDTPGYDPVSVTGIVAGGAQIVCFTTGRGSVYGCRPAPSLKVCSNNSTFTAMSGDMDFNAGTILTGQESVVEAGRRLFNHILEIASGRRTASEQLGIGAEEFVPWQLGAVL
ncbi:altronate dehydratase family protein [Actinoplanes sp. NBRC 103695]|uniref:UxaA family hydrolase n=1 Tax=Actinoplanes sp. NBRC 103695 TaxID=3032202 RepID=UPI0024A48AB6|nr:altronate dehydratase family protein [Actinoplanes sp. NBRC 103695]GLZ02405.1 dehydratase [Actinoplanes sp. NBRC 103695]